MGFSNTIFYVYLRKLSRNSGKFSNIALVLDVQYYNILYNKDHYTFSYTPILYFTVCSLCYFVNISWNKTPSSVIPPPPYISFKQIQYMSIPPLATTEGTFFMGGRYNAARGLISRDITNKIYSRIRKILHMYVLCIFCILHWSYEHSKQR